MPKDENGNEIVVEKPQNQNVASITTAQLNDPTIRNLVLRNLQTQANTGVLAPVNYDQMMGQELELAKQNVVNLGTAERIAAEREISNDMQKRGMLFSGAMTEKQLRTTEETRLREEAQFADVQKEVLSRYGGYKQQERQLQAGILTAGLSAETQGIIAQLENETQMKLGELNSRTDLSVADKQIEAAKIRAQTDVQVANIQSATQIKTAEMGVQSQEKMHTATMQAEYAKLGTQEKIAFAGYQNKLQIADLTTKEGARQFDLRLSEMAREFNLSDETTRTIANEELQEKARQFDISTEDGQQQFWANYNLASMKYNTDKAQWEAQFNEAQRTFDLTRADKNAQFWDNLNQAKEEFGWTKEKWEKEFNQAVSDSHEKLVEQAREFDLSNAAQNSQFWAALNLDKDKSTQAHEEWQKEFENKQDEFNLTLREDSKKFWANYELAKENLTLTKEEAVFEREKYNRNLAEQIRQFDVTTNTGIAQAADRLNWEKEQYWHTSQNVEDQQKFENKYKQDVFDEQLRQNRVVNDQWSTNFNEMCRQFGITSTDQRNYALATIANNKEALANEKDKVAFEKLNTFLNSPAVETLLADEKKRTELGIAVNGWFDGMVTDIGLDTGAIDKAADEIMTSVPELAPDQQSRVNYEKWLKEQPSSAFGGG